MFLTYLLTYYVTLATSTAACSELLKAEQPEGIRGTTVNIASIKHDPVSPESVNKVINVGFFVQILKLCFCKVIRENQSVATTVIPLPMIFFLYIHGIRCVFIGQEYNICPWVQDKSAIFQSQTLSNKTAFCHFWYWHIDKIRGKPYVKKTLNWQFHGNLKGG